jgi:hypothetical protein
MLTDMHPADLHVAADPEQLAQHVCCCGTLRQLLIVQALYVHLQDQANSTKVT